MSMSLLSQYAVGKLYFDNTFENIVLYMTISETKIGNSTCYSVTYKYRNIKLLILNFQRTIPLSNNDRW